MTGAMTMANFEDFLDEMVREQANPEPLPGLEQRIMVRLGEAKLLRASASSAQTVKTPRMVGVAWARVRHFVFSEGPPPSAGLFQPMARERSSRSFFVAVAAHVVAVALIGFLVERHTVIVHKVEPVQMLALDAPPPKILPRTLAAGGGGGQRGPTPVTRGTPPKFAEQQIVPPKAPPLVEPKIHLEPTVEVQRDLKMASSLPQIGVENSPLIGMSMGNGRGTGLGGGDGSGLGPGSGGNTGGGVRRIGGGVSAPVLLYSVEPEFSEEARKAKAAGNVLVNLWVDQNGNPSHVHVLRGVGMGLDEKAMAAVRQYRFRPAMENGRPVTVELNIDVTFQIF